MQKKMEEEKKLMTYTESYWLHKPCSICKQCYLQNKSYSFGNLCVVFPVVLQKVWVCDICAELPDTWQYDYERIVISCCCRFCNLYFLWNGLLSRPPCCVQDTCRFYHFLITQEGDPQRYTVALTHITGLPFVLIQLCISYEGFREKEDYSIYANEKDWTLFRNNRYYSTIIYENIRNPIHHVEYFLE